MTHQFELGQVVTTAEIYEAMQEHRGFKLDVMEALLKYRNRDCGDHPEWKGRRVAFLPGHGTTLFIEGVSFEIVDKE